MKNLYRFICLCLLIFFVAICSCSTKPDPREDVKKLIAAVDQSDTTALKESLDLNWMINQRLEGIPEKDRPALFPKKRQELLDDLTGNGATRTSWNNSLVVIGKSEVADDSATVEVTYIDKINGIKDYTRMGLYFKDGKWKIYDLKLKEM
ncbi:MAG TPA: hypothetical protein VMT04_07315 [Terriglobales bacterium]|nr:hypothetical protein [Terriglobales bacterium]